MLDRPSLATKELLDCQSQLACDLAEQRRRDVTTRVERDDRSSASRVSVLPVRASLTRFHEPEPLKEPGHFARLQDGVAITRRMKTLDVNPRMVGFSPGVSMPQFHGVMGRDAEFVYAASSWLPELVEVRAGGLIPIARQYPGAREFIESSKKEFPGANVSANGYGGCQILVEAIRRVGSLDRAKLRDAISKMDHNTVFGRFRVDRDGAQIGHQMLLFQWQDGKRVIVWPEELAAVKARFPTPPWSQRP